MGNEDEGQPCVREVKRHSSRIAKGVKRPTSADVIDRSS